MKFNSTFIALSVSALLFSGMANATITGTSSAEMTFMSTITSGTCTAKVTNGAGVESAEIAFGDVYKSDVVNKTRVEPLKIVFSNCSGVTKATVVAGIGAGGVCAGTGGTGDSYYSGVSATGFELWSGEADSGVQLKCTNKPAPQEVALNSGGGEFPMKSRIVLVEGKNASQIGTGAANTPVMFTIAYP